MKRVIKIVLWTLALGGFAYFAISQLSKNKAKMQSDAELTNKRSTTIPVVTTIVGKATLEGSFNVVGNFAPYQQVALMSETSGKILRLQFDNGSFVQAGATVASIDNDLLKIQLETSKTNLAKAENDFNRLKNLLGDGGITQQQLDDSKLNIDNLKQQLKSIEKQISMTYVKAPISGIVSNKMVENGSYVSPATKLADITNISRLKMQVYLTEEQVVTVKKGQKLTLKADLFPNKDFSGTVTFIDVNASESRRYLVEIEIANPGGDLKAGMTGTVYFEGGASREVVAIPRESVVGSLQDAKVYVVQNNKALLKPIETGAIFGDKVQVKSGLNEGDSIVVSGQINLEDGKDIKIAGN